MTDEPLKGKLWEGETTFTKEEVASAVAWLKKEVTDMWGNKDIYTSTYDEIMFKIDEAFADVVEK